MESFSLTKKKTKKYRGTKVDWIYMMDDAEKVHKLLKKKPSLVDDKDCYYLTPLHHACYHGWINVALLLIEFGAVNALDRWKNTPLAWALGSQQADDEGRYKSKETRVDVIKLLKSHGGLVLKELNERFTPENIELLHCVACLSPCDSFKAFDSKSLVRLARLYPTDFEDVDDVELSSQLDNYIRSVKDDDRFSNLKGLSDLCKTLVQTKKNKTYRFVYRLLKLALSLPVATATVERVFSGMKYVKDELRSRMSIDVES